MAGDDDEGGGHGGDVEITDGYLSTFAANNLQRFIKDVNEAGPVLKLRGYATGATPILVGNDSTNFKGASTLATSLKTYTESVNSLLTTVVDQLNTLITDLQLADLRLNNGLDEALDYAQFMQLAERTLNPGAGGGK
ncbi:hypothetical protein [Kitasatospora sp. NPDC050463]|uniref:hypothetical protein n=1 Tax=Kitasatospora sp. NPDC050463 TaxID=3155786 RepID=UPI0033DAF367